MPQATSNSTGPPAALPRLAERWTPAQRQGIETVGKSLLVSAAAGSGKTAILSERCAHLVCDAPEPYRCDVDELLVVTFTEAAATEMRHRIHQALRNRAEVEPGGPSPRLARQLQLIDQANVSTLHSFCARVLRQNFHLVGLDPGFTVMDGDEAKLLRLEIGRAVFEGRYEIDQNGSFQRLVDDYADGDDERLLEKVLRAHEMLQSLADPQAWLTDTRRRLNEGTNQPLDASELGRELIVLIARRIKYLRGQCEASIKLLNRLGGFPAYVAALQDVLFALRNWETLVERGSPELLVQEISKAQFDRLPSISNSVLNKDIAKGVVDAVLSEIKKGDWRNVLRFTEAQWREGMNAVAPHTQVFLELVEEFGEHYRHAKDDSRQLDFADLERYALEVLRDGNAPSKDRNTNVRVALAAGPGSDAAGETAAAKYAPTTATKVTDLPPLRPTPTALAYHKQFKHVLVDEYQDINELQDAILSLVSHECLAQRAEGRKQKADRGGGDSSPTSAPNFFAVGDVKQSIYRFRLAEPARFLDREHLFRSGQASHGKVIDLQANFRSRAPLLNAINGVFERLMTRDAVEIEYDAPHRLEPGQPYPQAAGVPCFAGSPIELHLLPKKFEPGAESCEATGTDAADEFELDRAEREATLIAKRIRQIMGLEGAPAMHVFDKAPQGLRCRPIRYSDIVVLLRSMRFKADQYARVMRENGVPVHSESGTGYFESVEVRDMLALLSLLDNQRQDIPLAAVLRSPLGGLPQPQDAMARIRLAYPQRRPFVPFYQAVVRYSKEKGDELAAHLRDFLAQLTHWRELAHRRPLAEMVWTIYTETGYLAHVCGLVAGEQRVANLMYLHERAAQFGTFQRRGLSRFLEFLENLRDEADLGQPSVATEADDVVRIMSIHRAKGLEFPVVVVPDLGKSINLMDCCGPILLDRRTGLGMMVADEVKRIRYPSLASTIVQERLREKSMAEELRVLYVAMTRAREHVIAVGTCGETKWDKWKANWQTHRGPLPADTVLSAGNILDWLGPVAAASAGAGEAIFDVVVHDSAEVAQWQGAGRRQQPTSARLAAAAKLEPLDPPPANDPAAQDVIERLRFAYPFEPYRHLAAVRSVTSVVAHGLATAESRHSSDDEQTQAIPSVPSTATFALPRFLSKEVACAATDIGTATHAVLEHLDYGGNLDIADVEAQIQLLVERRVLDPEHARRVDRAGIVWFLGSAAGRLMRKNAGRLLVEIPIYFMTAPPSAIERPSQLSEDQVMVRGRLDVLVPSDDGMTIVDYKTDAVDAAGVPARADSYRPQVEQYAKAVREITNRPVSRVYLVFLTPRIVWDVLSGCAIE